MSRRSKVQRSKRTTYHCESVDQLLAELGEWTKNRPAFLERQRVMGLTEEHIHRVYDLTTARMGLS